MNPNTNNAYLIEFLLVFQKNIIRRLFSIYKLYLPSFIT